jgi:alpha(1,3/1,4) fucosyltransferase
VTKACIVVPEAFAEGRLFDLANSRLNRDGCLYPFYTLREALAARGIDLETQDRNRPEDCEVVICDEMPRPLLRVGLKAKKILLLFETEVIRPDNWDLSLHRNFDIIFTWDDRFAAQGKYRKFCFPNLVPDDFESYALRPRQKLCTMIAGNKRSRHPLELYSERAHAIEWFERNHPEDFDLYGIGWDRRTFSGLLRPFNRIPPLGLALATARPSYGGPVVSKLQTFSEYRFAICYENVKDTPGYITEKIFDCLFAGCVPIYLGAQNIADYIPSECYINRADFPDYSSLYKRIRGMPEGERWKYVKAGIAFLKSERMAPFTSGEFARRVADAVCENK